MPGVSAKPCSRILQWLELESFGGKSDVTPIGQETFAVRRDEMCHRVTLPSMAVQPKSTVDCEDHPVDAPAKLAECWCRFSGHAAVLGAPSQTTSRP
jgi:hypothetical protein